MHHCAVSVSPSAGRLENEIGRRNVCCAANGEVLRRPVRPKRRKQREPKEKRDSLVSSVVEIASAIDSYEESQAVTPHTAENKSLMQNFEDDVRSQNWPRAVQAAQRMIASKVDIKVHLLDRLLQGGVKVRMQFG